jgi:integrase/recombinase XerC/integrase/recombinase XerD
MERDTLTLERIAELHAAAYRAESKSERTVEWHIVALSRYGDWVRDGLEETPALASLTLENVRRYVAHLRTQTCWANNHCMPQYARDRPLSDTTLNWHVRGLRAVASWLCAEGYTPTNVLARLKPPKVADYDVDILSTEEIAQILRHFNHHTEVGARDLAIFATLLDTRMRAGELATLTLDDLHLDQGYLVVFGKGRKERPLKVGQRAIKAIRFYLAHWRAPARENCRKVFLTVGRQMGEREALWSGAGEPLTVNAVELLLARVGKRTGVRRLHPHLLRHTFACRYLMEHHDPFALKNLLGHTSLAMTYRYVRAVERLMLVQGAGASVLDSLALSPHRMQRTAVDRHR